MPVVRLIYGEQEISIDINSDILLGDIISMTEFPFEQPCAGRGTCGKCKILDDFGLNDVDDVEKHYLSPGELVIGQRLACRARVVADAQVVLPPLNFYTNKVVHSSKRYVSQPAIPLGLAIDLGTTTVAAFLTMLDNGEVCAGVACLNQQSVFGSDVISRLAAAMKGQPTSKRLHRLAVASINQAVEALKLSPALRKRIQRVVLVSNPAMHHLLIQLPVEKLALMPFEPVSRDMIENANVFLDKLFGDHVKVVLPPLLGGYVGSDALACMTFFEFDQANGPMLAVDLGTNGEIMLTDGHRIVTASTAAGPAFEGVNISCGCRAVDGAVIHIEIIDESKIQLITIGGSEPIGLAGSGLIQAIFALREVNAIDQSGRINRESQFVKESKQSDVEGPIIPLSQDSTLVLTQKDVREFQKAKGAIRAAIDFLLDMTHVKPSDLKNVFLTGSFGGEIDVEAALGLGLIPPVPPQIIRFVPNGAGLGAAQFLTDRGLDRGLSIARVTEHVSLDYRVDFINYFTKSLLLTQQVE